MRRVLVVGTSISLAMAALELLEKDGIDVELVDQLEPEPRDFSINLIEAPTLAEYDFTPQPQGYGPVQRRGKGKVRKWR